MSDTFLETLQSDIVAILQATPSLAAMNIVPEDDGDMESKLAQLIGTVEGPTGKYGAVIVVMLPEPSEAEPNLPGPPLTVRCQIQVIEATIINRDPDGGTGVRSSVGALRVLQALHHHALATHALYAPANNPIAAVPVKTGHLSHMVNVLARFEGLQSPGRPGAVTAQMVTTSATAILDPAGANNAIRVTSTDLTMERIEITIPDSPSLAASLYVEDRGTWIEVVAGPNRRMLVTADVGNGTETIELIFNDTNWEKYISDEETITASALYVGPIEAPVFEGWQITGATWGFLVTGGSESSPDTADWSASTATGTATGTPVVIASAPTAAQVIAEITAEAIPGVTAANATGSNGTGAVASAIANFDATPALQLTCPTSGAAIRYTTDGTYPTPTNGTLYTAPIPGLETGEVVRAAAYSTGLLPGPLTEIEITE